MIKKIIINMGHGSLIQEKDGTMRYSCIAGGKSFAHNTPDASHHKGVFYEGYSNRLIGLELVAMLLQAKINYALVGCDADDTNLSVVTNAINNHCKGLYTKDECLAISIHSNAHDGNARGIRVYTSEGQTQSDVYATIFHEEISKLITETPVSSDKWKDGDPDYEGKFAFTRDTVCPSIILELGFFDNLQDAKLLCSPMFRAKLCVAMLNAIKRICGGV